MPLGMEVSLSPVLGIGVGLYMYNVIVKRFTFAISSPDEFFFREALKLVTAGHILCVIASTKVVGKMNVLYHLPNKHR